MGDKTSNIKTIRCWQDFRNWSMISLQPLLWCETIMMHLVDSHLMIMNLIYQYDLNVEITMLRLNYYCESNKNVRFRNKTDINLSISICYHYVIL